MMRRHLLRLACGVWFVITASASCARADAPSRPAATSPDGQIRIELSLAERGRGQASPEYSDLLSRAARRPPVAAGHRPGRRAGTWPRLDDREGPGADDQRNVYPVSGQAQPGGRPLRRGGRHASRAGRTGAALGNRPPGVQRRRCLSLPLSRPGGLAAPRDRRRTDPDPPARRRPRRIRSPLDGFTTSHEARYQKKAVSEIPADWLLGLPLLYRAAGDRLARGDGGQPHRLRGDVPGARRRPAGAVLACRLSPRPGEPKVAVRADLPHDSPWRVFMIADKVERLVESDLVLNLNAPCALADTSWIGPGKTTFPWWNGFYEDKVPVRDGAEHGDGEVLHRLLCRGGDPVPLARWQEQCRLVRRPDQSRTRGATSPGASRASTSARCSVTPRPRASRSASGCTGGRPRPTWTGRSRSTTSGASKG